MEPPSVRLVEIPTITTATAKQDCSASNHSSSSSPLSSYATRETPPSSGQQIPWGTFLVPQGLSIRYNPRSQVVQISQYDPLVSVSEPCAYHPSPIQPSSDYSRASEHSFSDFGDISFYQSPISLNIPQEKPRSPLLPAK